MHKAIVENLLHLRQVVSKKSWTFQAATHKSKVACYIDDYLSNRNRGIKQPVMDFLFEYYRFRPSWLKKWSPGFNAALEYDNPDDLPKIKELRITDEFAYLDSSYLSKKKSHRYIGHSTYLKILRINDHLLDVLECTNGQWYINRKRYVIIKYHLESPQEN